MTYVLMYLTYVSNSSGNNDDDDIFILYNSIHSNIPVHLTDLFL